MRLLFVSLGFFWTAGGVLASPSSVYDFTATSLEGKPVPLSTYKGKVLLIVNVASECGFTPQYKGLEQLYRKNKQRGLVVLGFPCNDFGSQEPGTSEEIKAFCSSKFQVTFPMFEKVSVLKGERQDPLYGYLGEGRELPSWNFGKYLVNRQGKVLRYFGSTVPPDSKSLQQAVQAALAEKP